MNQSNRIKIVVALAMLAGTLYAQTSKVWVPDQEWLMSARYNERPFEGYIRKKSTAIAMGRALMIEYYGENFLKELEPLDAKLLGDVWVVYGRQETEKDGAPVTGGPTTVEISKSTGTIINIRSER